MRIVFRETKANIIKMFPHLDKPSVPTGTELAMFKGGAKLYRDRRAGDWVISGYAQNGSDVTKALAEVIENKRVNGF